MKPAPKHLVSELAAFLTGWLILTRQQQRFADVLNVEAAQDIRADLGQSLQDAANTAHAAEVHDLEALRAMDDATRPDSDGGEAVTPAELAKVRRCVTRAADLSHTLAESLA